MPVEAYGYELNKRSTWTQTFKGLKFHPFDPKPEQIDIIDIAHALSMLCRWNGHIGRFYSVAEHSIHVASLVPDKAKLWALMHDAAEAYVGDLPKPIKDFIPDFEHAELNIQRVIQDKYQIESPRK
jgi:5'-deoxynucleotidase YfbR-like HD superfamily hydrolase